MALKYNIFTNNFDLVNDTGGGGGTVSGVTPSNSIDFTLIGGTNVSGDINISTVPADSNNTKVNLDIQTDGLRAEIANSSIKSAAVDLQGPFTLLDNNTGNIFTFPVSNTFTFLDYSLIRNGLYRCGRLLIANSASTVSVADEGYVETGVTGVTFGASISGGNVQVQYTSSNTGFNSTFKYSLKQWS